MNPRQVLDILTQHYHQTGQIMQPEALIKAAGQTNPAAVSMGRKMFSVRLKQLRSAEKTA